LFRLLSVRNLLSLILALLPCVRNAASGIRALVAVELDPLPVVGVMPVVGLVPCPAVMDGLLRRLASPATGFPEEDAFTLKTLVGVEGALPDDRGPNSRGEFKAELFPPISAAVKLGFRSDDVDRSDLGPPGAEEYAGISFACCLDAWVFVLGRK
jgi:hypothetical protein